MGRERTVTARWLPGTAAAVVLAVGTGCTADPSPATSPSQPARSPGASPTTPTTPTTTTPATTTQPPPPAARAVKVTIVGDIMLGRRVGDHAAAVGDPAAPLRPLQARLGAADVTVGNLESTLSTFGFPRQGGDSFAADPSVLTGLRAAGFDVLSLANNHTGDFGPRALRQTVRRVREGGIRSVGAGPDQRRAWRPVVLSRRGTSFGFLAFNAIGETPRATRQSPGAASVRMEPRTGPLSDHDVATTEARVRRLAKRVDVVIVLPHWGDQYTHRPVPDQRRVGKALIAAGATAVVGGHPHWVQDVEEHAGRLLVHSLGNFVFDMDFSLETREGVLLELTFRDADVEAAKLVPYRIDDQFRPRLVHGEAAQSVLRGVRGLRYVSVPAGATPTRGR